MSFVSASEEGNACRGAAHTHRLAETRRLGRLGDASFSARDLNRRRRLRFEGKDRSAPSEIGWQRLWYRGDWKPMTAALVQFRKQMPLPVADDPRWSRLLARDKTADGHFWYSVST